MDKTALALAITKALAYTENGGAPDVNNEQQGKSGEMKSIFQFLPETWKAYSKQVTGKDNVPLTPQNEYGVVTGKVNQWLAQGYNTQQIASMWNSGQPNPDKTGSGVNKEGVAYNTPEYAQKVQNYTDEFLTGANQFLQNQNKSSASSIIDPQSRIAMANQITQAAKQPIHNSGNPPMTPQPLAMQQMIAQQSGQGQGNPNLAQQTTA